MTTLTNAQKLAEALDAMHRLKTGRLSVSVEVDGRKVHYNRLTIADLQGYIDELTDVETGRCVRIGAIGFLA